MKINASGTLFALSSGTGYLLKRNDGSDTGVYSTDISTVGFAAGGSAIFYAYANGSVQSNSSGYIGLSTSPHVGDTADVRFYRDASGIFAQRNGTNAQKHRVYGTYTDASNYTRVALNTTSTTAEIAAETAGTGADDIDLALTPAGAGNVKFGSHSAIGAETVTGYITIKDSAGNSRKLAVVS